jgi:hypothetical protein
MDATQRLNEETEQFLSDYNIPADLDVARKHVEANIFGPPLTKTDQCACCNRYTNRKVFI